MPPTHLPHIILTSPQRNQPPVPFIGNGDNSSSMRRLKSGAYGCMIHAAGAGGGWHCAADGAAFDQDRQAQIGSSEAITQASLRLLRIGKLLEMTRFTFPQALFERLALLTFGKQLASLGSRPSLRQLRQNSPVTPALNLPGQRDGHHQQEPTKAKLQSAQHNTSRARAQSLRRSSSPLSPPLM